MEPGERKHQVLRPMTKDTLALRVCEALKAYIVSENLQPGSRLPSERQLGTLLSVSRNVVREGLSLLVAEGIITKKPGKGIYVAQVVDEEALAEAGSQLLEQERARYAAIREARAAVELGAIGLIVNRISDPDLKKLEQIAAELEARTDRGERFFEEDMHFHLTLLRAAGNEFLLQWSPLVEEVMRAWVYQTDSLAHALKSTPQRDEAARVAAEHRALLDAIRRRDVETARNVLKRHLLIEDL